MIKNKSWETFVWIIIRVFILSLVIIWITNLLINTRDTLVKYSDNRDISILINNTNNIIKNIDTSNIEEDELFYLFKNTGSNSFSIFTWITNANYKYIDRLWNKIDNLNTFDWKIYSRILLLQRDDIFTWKQHQIIKVSIKRVIKK